MNSADTDEWIKAIESELSAHAKNGTWKIVPKEDHMREISAKWVFKIKQGANGEVERYKTRLVARGFSQIKGVDYGDIYSPVVHGDSIRLLFALSAQYKLKFKQFDVATAFLNGELTEDLYLVPPDGVDVPDGYTCRLVKSLYGLRQAPRCFNNKFTEMLRRFGMKRIFSDPSVFVTEGDPPMILALYVDDGIVFARDDTDIDRLIKQLTDHFEIKVVDSAYFLGIEIVKNNDCSIFLHQRGYAKQILEKFGFLNGRDVKAPLEVGHLLNKKETLATEVWDCPYAEVIGSLNYLATRTRPDLSYALSVLSKFTKQPRFQHWKALKRVLRYVRKTMNYGLIYKAVDEPRLICYTDADHGGDQENSKSTSGMVVFINTGPIAYR